MPSATVTSKGQITLPKQVRDELRVQAGDEVDFVIDPNGEIRVRAGRHDITALRGLLRSPGRKPVSIAQMDQAVRRAHRSRR